MITGSMNIATTNEQSVGSRAKRRLASILFAGSILCVVGPLLSATVQAAGQSVDNFTLFDHLGEAQELYYQRDAKAVVVIVQGNGCQIVRSLLSDFKSLRDDYAEQGVEVFMLNANLQDTRASIAAEAAEWDIDIPILHDSAQLVGRSLELTRTAEVLVIDPRTWQVVYRGALNDRVGLRKAKRRGLRVLRPRNARCAGSRREPRVQGCEWSGCIINFPDPALDQQISYVDDVVPVLADNCLHCHTQGGIAPWAMSEYRMVQGFAPMMREVLRTKRMPPWHADPEVGKWQHDAGISDEEVSTLVRWIEAGAPRGDGEDPLPAMQPPQPEWVLGEPDLIVEVPAYNVPATGIVDYQFPHVANPLDRDVWVVAATIIPGDRQAVHHVLMGSADKPPQEGDQEGVFQNYIMGYAPGNESAHMPEGTGVYVPVGGVYSFQMHYTPYGREATDTTKVGLYFASDDNPPANFLRQHVVLNPKINIPPHAAAHPESAYFEFWDDAVLYSLVPHAHYRGRSSNFELLYPNGERELILSVPNYDFNWQRTYSFEEPKSVPAGTRIIHTTVYDNSVKNPGNPDPERSVPWGLQSKDEMLYGSVTYSWVNESSSEPMHNNVTADTAQWMGFMDVDMDGRVQRQELPSRLREGIGWKWYLLDRNFDGGLNLTELERLMRGLMESSGP